MTLLRTKKKKLRKILAALDPSLKADLLVEQLKEDTDENLTKNLNELIKKISIKFQELKKSLLDEFDSKISQLPNLSSELHSELKNLRSDFETKLQSLEKEDIRTIQTQMLDMAETDLEEDKNLKEEIRDKIEDLRREFFSRLSNLGGGQANREIRVNSSVISNRYTDINFIPGSIMSIATANDDVNKRVNFTISASAVDTGITQLTGDVTAGPGSGSQVATLATVNGNVGTFGSSTSIPSFTVNAKGLITAASGNVVIAPAGTLTGTTLASNVVTSSLTTIGTLVAGAVPASLVTAGTFGTGAYVMNTSLTNPLLIGGTATTSDLTLKTTSGVGASGADMHFLVGNNGATEAMTILNNADVGIGTTAPTARLTVSQNTSTLPAPPAGTTLHIATSDGNITRFLADSFGNTGGNAFNFRMANGTAAAPTAILSGNAIAQLGGFAYGATAYTTTVRARITLNASQNWTDTAQGTFMDFYTTANGAATAGGTTRLRIENDGNFGFGLTGATAVIHIKAGTATASTAPLKFNTGTLLTTAEAGAVEFLTDDFYATITTGAARKKIVLDNGVDLVSGRVPFATTNGRLVDDADMTFSGSTLTVTNLTASTGAAIGVATGTSLAVSGKLSSTATAVTIAAAATTFAITSNVVTVTGDALANIVATITGGVSGQLLTLIFVDALVTITDDATGTADTVNLSGAFVSTANDTLTLVYNGTSWREVARSLN